MLIDPIVRGFEHVKLVGFAFKQVGTGWHVAFVYKLDKKAPRFRHQCEHNFLQDEEPKNLEYLWTDILALSPINKRLIANKLSRAGGDRIPYGIGFDPGRNYIDRASLKYKLTDPGNGLTCSTYIMAVLDSLGFSLFDTKAWTPNVSDAVWQAAVVDVHERKFPDDAPHFAKEKDNIGGPRYRPEHVVGSADAEKWPIAKGEAEAFAATAISEYRKLRPSIPR